MKIEEVILFTNSIQEQKQFYKNVLEFELILDSTEKISFKTGESILSFQYKETFKSSHLAFNIPSNKETEALFWLQKRVEILPYIINLFLILKAGMQKQFIFMMRIKTLWNLLQERI